MYGVSVVSFAWIVHARQGDDLVWTGGEYSCVVFHRIVRHAVILVASHPSGDVVLSGPSVVVVYVAPCDGALFFQDVPMGVNPGLEAHFLLYPFVKVTLVQTTFCPTQFPMIELS